MFSKLSNFVRQHKKKLIFSAGLAGGVYLLNRYLRHKIEEWETRQTQDYLDQIKHQHHFEGILQTADSTILALVTKVRETLYNNLETDSLLDKLRNKPHNRLEIWEEMKMRILTFAVCSVYSECILVTFLRVQLGVIGGYVYLNSQRQTKDAGGVQPALTNQEVHQRYLSLVQYFLETGINDLARLIQRAVVSAFGHISLKEKLTIKDFSLAFDYIKRNLAKETSPLPDHTRYIFPDDLQSSESLSGFQPVLKSMVIETRDIIENEDFLKAFSVCVDLGMTNLLLGVKESFLLLQDADEEESSEAQPLARLLPVLRNNLVAGRRDAFVKQLLQMDMLRSLLANVYEAFCQTSDVDAINHNFCPLS